MIDLTIIGAGINGLLTALAAKQRFPDKEVVVLEQEPFCGDHTSGRNSGVLHSGIYYPTNSLKHQMCMAGNKQWKQIASQLKLPINHCGKFIFAKLDQAQAFASLQDQANRNQVSFRFASAQELKEIQAYVYCDQAIFIPSTGIIDTSSTIKAIEYECEKAGVHLLKKQQAEKIEYEDHLFHIQSTTEEFTTNFLINCAGLEAVNLRQQLGLNELENYYVRGTYFKTYQDYYKKALLYPMPHADLKGLGVHTTFDHAQTLRFGPDTEDIASIDYQINPQNIAQMKQEIPKVFKQLQTERLSEDYCGIRPKILLEGKLYNDFWIKRFGESKIAHYAELCGIESPGLTASPAIAQYLVDSLKFNEPSY